MDLVAHIVERVHGKKVGVMEGTDQASHGSCRVLQVPSVQDLLLIEGHFLDIMDPFVHEVIRTQLLGDRGTQLWASFPPHSLQTGLEPVRIVLQRHETLCFQKIAKPFSIEIIHVVDQ